MRDKIIAVLTITLPVLLVLAVFVYLFYSMKVSDDAHEQKRQEVIAASDFAVGDMVTVKLDGRKGMIVGVTAYSNGYIRFDVKFPVERRRQVGHTLGSPSQDKELYKKEYNMLECELVHSDKHTILETKEDK